MIPPSTPLLVVVSSGGERLRVYDATTFAHLHDVDVLAQPHELAVDVDRGLVYVSHTYRSGVYTRPGARSHEVSVVDVRAGAVVDVWDLTPEVSPHGLALDTARGVLHVSVEQGPAGDGAIVTLDTSTGAVLSRVEVGARGPHWLAVTPDGTKAYTANKEAPFVSVVDLVAGRQVGRIPVSRGAEELTVAGGRLHVATPMIDFAGGDVDQRPAALVVVDTDADEVRERVPLDHPASPVHVTSRGDVLVGLVRFADRGVSGPGRLDVLARPTPDAPLERRLSVGVGAMPITIRSSPDGRHAYVAGLRSGTVDVVDLDTGSVVAVLDVDPDVVQGAHGIAHVR